MVKLSKLERKFRNIYGKIPSQTELEQFRANEPRDFLSWEDSRWLRHNDCREDEAFDDYLMNISEKERTKLAKARGILEELDFNTAITLLLTEHNLTYLQVGTLTGLPPSKIRTLYSQRSALTG